jgi:hypothetical protein
MTLLYRPRLILLNGITSLSRANHAKLVIDASASGQAPASRPWLSDGSGDLRRQYVGPMDDSEKAAKLHLEYLGFECIVYEPDGNVPPDFLVNGRIAIEVRRLNQNEGTESAFRGLEEIAIPLQTKIAKLLASLGPPYAGSSWFVHYTIRRPVAAWDVLRPAIRQHLIAFRDDRSAGRSTSITVADCIQIKLIRASTAHATCFVSGGYSDDDSGGWVFQETQKNLRLCVNEKTLKIAPVRHKYTEWWLILVDRIGYGVDDCDRPFFHKHLGIRHSWDKVILLNPLNPRSAFEIQSVSDDYPAE